MGYVTLIAVFSIFSESFTDRIKAIKITKGRSGTGFAF
jgi:hypothetical protein